MKRTAGALRQKAHDLGLPLGHRRWLGLSPRSKVRSRKAVALLNMAVEPLAMCYPGLAGGHFEGPATASIQNNSGPPQGLAGLSMAGWCAGKPTARVGRRL